MAYGTGKYTYELVDGWAKGPEGFSFNDAPGLAVDSQDRVYVLSRSDHPVSIFDREGNLLNWWGEKYFARAHGSYIDPDGSVYCTDDHDNIVTKFTYEGKPLMVLGERGKASDSGYVMGDLATIKRGAPPFNRPTGIALSSSGEIFISDGYGNARVHKFTHDGKLLLSWGEPGVELGEFRLPHDIWVDKQDRVWVCDRQNDRIQIFDTQGKFLNQWTDLIRPTSMVMDDEGTVYVSELSRRVSIFTNDGKLLARWGEGKPVQRPTEGKELEPTLFIGPHSIAVDSRGDIYIGEICRLGGVNRGTGAVQKFARKT